MSGLVGVGGLDVAVGLLAELAVKITVPLALGLGASLLPGTAAARHLRLATAVASVPVLVVATALARGGDAAFVVGAPAWPLAAWSVGAGVVLARLGLGLRAVRRLPATPGPDGLEVCAEVQAPVTAGWRRPRILVPIDFARWSPADRAAALAHERAHVRRADWLVHVGAWVIGAACWFHPLAALARARLALLAECAADDEVLAQGHDPATYAAMLLRLGRPGPAVALSLGRSTVGVRVRRLLGPRAARGTSAAPVLLVAALVAVTGAVAPAAAWHAPAPVATCGPPRAWTPLPPPDPEVPVIASVLALLGGVVGPPTEPALVPAPDAAAAVEARTLAPTVAAMEALAARAEDRPDEDLAAARGAVTVLATNCPYHRATFQLVALLDRELAALDAGALDAEDRARFELLVRGVRAQAALSRRLGGDELPQPLGVVDYLAGDLLTGPQTWIDGPAFAASPDPLGDTEAVFARVPELVVAMPPATHAQLEHAWRVLDPTVDQSGWFDAVAVWSDAYRDLAPALARGGSAERVARLARLLEAYGHLSC